MLNTIYNCSLWPIFTVHFGRNYAAGNPFVPIATIQSHISAATAWRRKFLAAEESPAAPCRCWRPRQRQTTSRIPSYWWPRGCCWRGRQQRKETAKGKAAYCPNQASRTYLQNIVAKIWQEMLSNKALHYICQRENQVPEELPAWNSHRFPGICSRAAASFNLMHPQPSPLASEKGSCGAWWRMHC